MNNFRIHVKYEPSQNHLLRLMTVLKIWHSAGIESIQVLFDAPVRRGESLMLCTTPNLKDAQYFGKNDNPLDMLLKNLFKFGLWLYRQLRVLICIRKVF